MENIINDYLSRKLEMDDEFEIGCDRCGKCCHIDTLILTGYDVYRIAKYLGKTTIQLINENCFVYVGNDSNLPIVSIRPRTADGSCRFLRKGRCTVNEVKPNSCALFPLGRMYDTQTEEYIYFKQDISCRNKETSTLREWLNDINIEEIDRMARPWGNAVMDLALYLQTLKNLHKEQLVGIRNIIFITLYLNYDTSKDYVEQLEKNMGMLEESFPKFNRKYKDY